MKSEEQINDELIGEELYTQIHARNIDIAAKSVGKKIIDLLDKATIDGIKLGIDMVEATFKSRRAIALAKTKVT